MTSYYLSRGVFPADSRPIYLAVGGTVYPLGILNLSRPIFHRLHFRRTHFFFHTSGCVLCCVGVVVVNSLSSFVCVQAVCCGITVVTPGGLVRSIYRDEQALLLANSPQ